MGKVGRALVMALLFRLSSAVNIKYIHDQSLDNMKCVGADIEFETDIGADSSIQCTVACEKNPGCKGVFHKSSPAAKCYGCKTLYINPDGLVSETGTKYHRPYAKYQEECTARVQCLPHSNQSCEDTLHVCVCTPGYSYNPTSATCILTQDCVALGSTYQRHPLKYISGLDNGVITPATVDTCIDACNAAPSNSCLSFEFTFVDGIDICYLQLETAVTAAYAFVFAPFSSIYDHYSRNCA